MVQILRFVVASAFGKLCVPRVQTLSTKSILMEAGKKAAAIHAVDTFVKVGVTEFTIAAKCI